MGKDTLVNSNNMWWLNKWHLKEWKEFPKFWKCGNFLETPEAWEHPLETSECKCILGNSGRSLGRHFDSMMAHDFCLFQYGSIKSLSSTILLWHVRYRCLMSHTSRREEHLKFMTHKLSSLVQIDRGQTMTIKGLSPRNHILEMQLHCWLDPQEVRRV